MPDLALHALNIEDLRQMARRRLTRGLFEFIDRGSEDDIALRHNREALQRIKLRSRVLNNTSHRSPATTLFGEPVGMPVVIGPTGPAGFVWFRGETALARAATKARIPFTLASTSNTPMEKILADGGGRQWFQLYVWRDLDASLVAAKRARDAGFEGLVITVDSPVGFNREHTVRNGMTDGINLSSRNALDIFMHPRWLADTIGRYLLADGHVPRFVNIHVPEADPDKVFDYHQRNDALDWDFLRRMRDMWPRKLIAKGVLHPEDARKCVECGVDAIVVSNHGANASDAAPAPIDMLPSIVAAVGGRTTIIIDSGFRRGSDILKAIGLGADIVMIGRATLYGVSAAGEAGASRALDILHAELRRTMGVLAVNSLDEITPDHVIVPPDSLMHVIG